MSDTTLTEAQLASNRENAQKSTGPRTPEGKLRSRNNSFRHGLTGRRVLVPEGEEEIYHQFTAGIVGSLHPANPLELQLSRDVADAHWRLSRIKSIEDAMLAQAELADSGPDALLLAQGQLFLDNSGSFTNITLYESRIQRGIKNSMDELRRLQSERLEREKLHMPAAIEHYKLHLMQDLPFDPAASGFVFSSDEMDAALNLEILQKRVDHARLVKFNLTEYQKKYPPIAA